MEVQPKTSTLVVKTILVAFALLILSLFLIEPRVTSSTQGERKFENAVSKDVPIKLSVKKDKEQSFKDLKNGKWVREFELELTNTGDRPIYYIYIMLISDVQVNGSPMVFPVMYGRPGLGDIISKAEPDDIPIKPGQSHVFKIHPGQIRPWERAVLEGRRPDATKLSAYLQTLSFGDGTGYLTNEPYPPPGLLKSLLNSRAQALKKGRPREPVTKRKTVSKTSVPNMPVSLIPANFLISKSSSSATLPTSVVADGCQFEACIGIVVTPPENFFDCYKDRP